MAEKKTISRSTKAKSGATTSKAKATPAKNPAAAKQGKTKGADNYTKPELRQRLKDKIQAEDKGGRAGQWSARKAQLLATEYEKEGGGYKKATRTTAQKHLEHWTEEKWQTADGKKAVRGKTTARYLPKEAWKKLPVSERKATDEKKKAASRTGKQHVENTPAAKRARKSASS